MIVMNGFAAEMMATGTAPLSVQPAQSVAFPPGGLPAISAARPNIAAPVMAAQAPPSASVEAALRGQQDQINKLVAAVNSLMQMVNTQGKAISENENLIRTLAANVEQNLGVIDQTIRDQGDALTQVAGAVAGTFTPRRAAGPANRWTAESRATRGSTKGTVAPQALVAQRGGPATEDSGVEVEAEFAEFGE